MLGPFSTSIAAASYCLSISQPGDSSCGGASHGVTRDDVPNLNEELKGPAESSKSQGKCSMNLK